MPLLFYVDVGIWPHTLAQQLKNHSKKLERISPTSDPIFLLAQAVLQFRRVEETPRDDDEKNPACEEVHFASNSSGLLPLHFFPIFFLSLKKSFNIAV